MSSPKLFTGRPDPAFWRFRNVFVTGATGLLGGRLVSALVQVGARVTALVRDWVPDSQLVSDGLLDRVNVVRGCVEDLATLERALNEFEIQTVFHLAAQTIVDIAVVDPLSTFETNIRGTWNLLEACRRVGRPQQILIASSDKAYGEQKELPYREDAPLNGTRPYDVSKSCTDLLARSYFCTYRLPVCVTRCGNFFGGGDLNFNRLVPGCIRATYLGKPLEIRSDGRYVRDYIYVEDAVLAYLWLSEQMSPRNLAGEAFNFSTEWNLPVLELVEIILRLMGRTDLRSVILNQARHEIPAQMLSAEKARRLLGWRSVWPVEEALRTTIDWYLAYFQKHQPRPEGAS